MDFEGKQIAWPRFICITIDRSKK